MPSDPSHSDLRVSRFLQTNYITRIHKKAYIKIYFFFLFDVGLNRL